jgi:hypothetical protein
MKLDRMFTTQESEQTSRQLITNYLVSNGYKARSINTELVFDRGSVFGSFVSFLTKNWKATVSIVTHPNPDQSTTIIATFNINTTGQFVTKGERNSWEKEITGLITSVNGNNATITPVARLEEQTLLKKRHIQGANWFYWIAGLSLISSLVLLFGGSLNFLIGLGITQLIDGISIAFAQRVTPNTGAIIRAAAVTLNIAIAGVFVLFGYLARRRRWSFIVGMIIYTLDGLIFLIVPDFFSIGFHLLALFGLYNGFKAFGLIKQNDAANAV